MIRNLIAFLYRKYCRDKWHDEMWEYAFRIGKVVQQNMYRDIGSRIPIDLLEKMIKQAKEKGVEKYSYITEVLTKAYASSN